MLWVFVAPMLSAQSSFMFNAPRDYIVGQWPESVVLGDFNGDGRPDIAVANFLSNNISVLLQSSDGTFQGAVNYPVGRDPISLQVGDFNGDGKLDLALLNQNDNTLSVLLGNGDGTFQAQVLTTFTQTLSSTALAVGDFNGDGKADVAVTEPLPQVGTFGVAVLVGNGDGTFQTPVTYADGSPVALAAADINKDGKLDLVAGGNGVSALLGNGNGTFQAAMNSATSLVLGSSPLLIADFNQDGNLDIASATTASGVTSLTLFLGSGAGTFQSTVLSLQAVPLAVGDVNGDGKPDLIATGNPLTIESLVNSGSATFTVGQSLAVTSSQVVAALADLNGDQKLDLVAGYFSVSAGPPNVDFVSVLDGNGDGTFGPPVPSYPVTTAANSSLGTLLASDFNGDGKPDLGAGIVVNPGSNTNLAFGLLLNDGTSFSPSAITPVESNAGFESTAWVEAGDFNGDGRMDLVVATGAYEIAAPGISILLGNGDGTFETSVLYGAGMTGPIAIGDFNNDGILDMFGMVKTSSGNSLGVLLGQGDGTFGFPVSSIAVGAVNYVVAGDYNRDGKLDLAIVDANVVELFFGNGDGTFTAGPVYQLILEGDALGLAVGDVNGDGILDLVVGAVGIDAENSSLVVLLGNGDGTFQSPIATAADPWTAPAAIADFNLDGKADFVALGIGNNVSFSMGNGDGTFQPAEHFYVASPAYSLAVADFDGNGSPDVAVAGGTTLSVLYNGASGPAAEPSPGRLSFGSEGLGYASPAHTLTLSNSGSAALSVTGISISGAQSGDYSQNNTCGSSLAAGATCTISVIFAPQASGLRTAAIQIADNAFNTPQTINLTGTGATPSAAASVMPGTLTFNSQYVGSTSSPQTVTLSSTGSIPLTVTGISLAGAQAGDFSQTNNCGISVANGSSCQVTVSFAPTAAGGRAATLSIGDNAGNSPQTVALAGTGASPSIGLGPGSGSTTATVPAGQTASYTLSIGGADMSGTASLTCTGAPQGATCSVPSSVTVSGTTASTLNVSVATTSRTMASVNPNTIRLGGVWAGILLGLALLPAAWRKRSAGGLYLGAMVASLMLISSCGSSSSGPTINPNGTPAGTYNLKVTATLNSTTQTVTLNVVVQ
jgi:FG-GAP-like repeat/Abnormal spindle-like microcephaly-assoc'd, ASPM-SPD-2-Hydin/FG-GAP repeat